MFFDHMRFRLLAAAVVLLVPTEHDHAVGEPSQPRVVHVSGHVACAGCRLTVTESVGVGDEDGPGMLSGPPDVVLRLSDGRILIAGESGDERVPRLFDARGGYVRSLGRLGSGPGEYRGVSTAFASADSLVLFDWGNSRFTVVTPNAAVARSAHIPGRVLAAAGTSSGFVASTRILRPDGTAVPVHRFSAEGVHLGSLGDSAEVPRSRFGFVRHFALSTARDGGVWTAPAYGEYTVRRWDADGRLLRTLVIHSPWFRATDISAGITPDTPPISEISHVWETRDGLVWVLARTADPTWPRGLGTLVREGDRIGYSIVDENAVWDGMLEVIDPGSGRVVTRRRLDRVTRYRLADDVIGSFDDGEDRGVPRVRTFRVQLVGYASGPR